MGSGVVMARRASAAATADGTPSSSKALAGAAIEGEGAVRAAGKEGNAPFISRVGAAVAIPRADDLRRGARRSYERSRWPVTTARAVALAGYDGASIAAGGHADERAEPRIGEHLHHHVRRAGGRRRQGVQWLGAKLPLLKLLGSKGHLTLDLWCRD